MFIKTKSYDQIIPIFCLLIYSLAVVSCREKELTKNRFLSLDPRYLQIESISSFANCNGPNGAYVTRVTSKKDGSLFFSQSLNHQQSPYVVELSSNNNGYVIDENKRVIDTLSNVSVEMIRSHDFHRLQTNPEFFFNHINFETTLDTDLELYSGIDRLNNPVKIYYDRAVGQIREIELLNMMDTTEVIEIVYKKWIESNYGKLAKEIEIVQARKDTFNFDFETIEIN